MNLICTILGHKEGNLKMDTVAIYIPTGCPYKIYLCKRCKQIIHKRKQRFV